MSSTRPILFPYHLHVASWFFGFFCSFAFSISCCLCIVPEDVFHSWIPQVSRKSEYLSKGLQGAETNVHCKSPEVCNNPG